MKSQHIVLIKYIHFRLLGNWQWQMIQGLFGDISSIICTGDEDGSDKNTGDGNVDYILSFSVSVILTLTLSLTSI